MVNRNRILCIGEILWDSLPSGLFLGGAILNVCYHLNQLGREAFIVSKVGNDRLGMEALNRIKNEKISIDHIQIDKDLETGFVEVEFDDNKNPNYKITEFVAWDYIEFKSEFQGWGKKSDGLVFGTLSQRNEKSRSTIQKLWEFNVTKYLDLNLREPYVEKNIVLDSLKVADVVKLNLEELTILKEWFEVSGDLQEVAEELSFNYDLKLVCITKGRDGSMMFQNSSWFEHSGYPVIEADPVGAGDAFFAALIHGIQNKKSGLELLKFANAAGSLVAQKHGATPNYGIKDLEAIVNNEENMTIDISKS